MEVMPINTNAGMPNFSTRYKDGEEVVVFGSGGETFRGWVKHQPDGSIVISTVPPEPEPLPDILPGGKRAKLNRAQRRAVAAGGDPDDVVERVFHRRDWKHPSRNPKRGVRS